MKMSKNSSNIKQYKILLLGDSDSNKTKIFNKIIYGKTDKSVSNTIGGVFDIENIIYKKKKYSIRLHDTASQERFRSIARSYYHITDGYFIIFNLANEYSLNSIKEWIESLKEEKEYPKIVILGHEIQNNNNISDDIINQYLKNYSEYKFLKVCPEKNKNIYEALYTMIDLLDNDYEGKKEEENIIINRKNKNKLKQNKKDLKLNNINNLNVMKNDNKSSFDNSKLKKYLDF